jgi:serine phosphatase RsbU (regulator of sigma subunit)
MTTQLEEGDAVVLYSDGVSEAVVDGGELGVCGLKRLLAKTTSAHELVNALATSDDLTMLVIKI